MTARELLVYIRGAAKRSTTQAWLTARFALEGLGKRGLRPLNEVLGELAGPRKQAEYDPVATQGFLRHRIGAHNARVAAGLA